MTNGDRRHEPDDGPSSDEALRALLQRGGPRPAPPPEDEAAIRAAVFAEWNAVTRRRVQAWRAAAAVAATAVVASLVMFSGERPSSAAVVAHAERVRGTVAVAGGDASGALEGGEALVAGATLVTNDGEAALRLATGGSLRLASGTRLVLTADGAVELIAGKLYFDSENARGDDVPAFVVVTAAGSLHDVGTQFMVSAERGSVEVGVRDGRVAWRTGASGPAVEAGAGERLAVAGDGRIQRGTVATFGPYWEWAERLAPPFSLDGRTLSEVVEWTAVQTGRRVVYAAAAVEAEADTVVHITGSADLGLLDQLALAMTVTGFEYRIEGDSIVVALQ